MNLLLPTCYCGSPNARPSQMNGLPVLVCECGAMRQRVEFTLGEYADWYREVYHDVIYRHTYDHDRRIAGVRLDAYGTPAGTKLLDVGAGNNAFVDEANARGIDAWGQDLAEQAAGPRTFVGPLQAIAFPTESFDVVTMHDVLEHVPDPVAFLHEVRRILKPGGKLIVDFPRFHHASGLHHWKPVEHIWLLDEAHLVRLLERAGLRPESTDFPIDSKVVVTAASVPLRRISVLVPPGIGDSYWTFTKLPGLIRQQGVEGADVFIHYPGGVKRTDPYVRNVALAAWRDYRDLPPRHPIFDEAYRADGRSVFPNEFGVDFFVSYNGVLTHGGRSLTSVNPELGVEWRPRTFFSKEAEASRDSLRSGGPYVVAYFVDHGMYKKWLTDFSILKIDSTLSLLQRHGYRVVVVGAEWDKESIGDKLGRKAGRVNMVGQTSFDQLYGALSGAAAVVGFPSGATLLAPTLRVPTVLLWNRFFDQRFWKNSVPPDAPYRALDTRNLTPGAASDAVFRLMGAQQPQPAGAR